MAILYRNVCKCLPCNTLRIADCHFGSWLPFWQSDSIIDCHFGSRNVPRGTLHKYCSTKRYSCLLYRATFPVSVTRYSDSASIAYNTTTQDVVPRVVCCTSLLHPYYLLCSQCNSMYIIRRWYPFSLFWTDWVSVSAHPTPQSRARVFLSHILFAH